MVLMKKYLKISALIALPLVTFFACHKSSTPSLTNSDDNGGYASDAAILESNSNAVMSMADNAVNASGANLRTTSCAELTYDTSSTTSTKTITINFGTGCTGFDGNTRSGEVIVSWTGHYKDSNSVHTITSNNYYVNGYKFVVNKTVTNMGTNASGQDWYTVTVNDSIYLTSDSVISWTGNRTRTWVSGYNTSEIYDDVYDIGGTTTVVRANGHSFTFSIESGAPLVVANDCAYIEAGKVDITGSSISGTRVLNYGDTPNCDRMATLTIGGVTYNIVLRK